MRVAVCCGFALLLGCWHVTGLWGQDATGPGQSPQEAVQSFQVAAGFKLQLFASEPEIRQPVSMTFDARGRMWVVQYLQYPNPAGLKAVAVDQFLRTVYDRVPEPPPHGPQGADRITILEDTDGDGHADKQKDFVSGLNLATGVAVGHGGAFIVQPPYLLYYPDKDADDVPDGDPEVLLTGFGMEDAHAFANSLQWGPDGWLYGAQGSTVTANIRGIKFQQGIWRYHPLTKAFELFAEGGGNTWGADFDRHGNMLAGTNYGGVAMLHQVQGAYYVKNFGKHGELQNPHAYGFFEHVPHKDFKGGHVTIGGVVYQGNSFPSQFRNQYLAANVLSNAIYWHVIERQGSTFVNRMGGDLLTTEDQWFRPVDCTVGPDGSLFLADWYDKRANHVDPKDDWDRSNGRIYKLVADGTQPVKDVNLAKLSSHELLELLGSDNDWYARQARNLLAARRDESIWPELIEMIRQPSSGTTSPQLPVEALWALYVSGGFDDTLAAELLSHPHPDVRGWTVRFLGDAEKLSADLLPKVIELAQAEREVTVRSQLACSSKRLPAAQALPIIAQLLRHVEDAQDPHLPLLLWWAIEDKAISDRAAVLAMLSSEDLLRQTIVRETILERLARRYAAAAESDDFAACAELLRLAADETDKARILTGMEKGLEGRQLQQVPAALGDTLAGLLSVERPSVRAVRLALRLGEPSAMDRALAVVMDAKAAADDRLSLLDTLSQLGDERCAQQMLELVKDSEQSPAIQTAAVSGLQRSKQPEIGQQLIALFPSLKPEVRARCQALLCSRQPWALALLNEVDAGRIPTTQIGSDQLQQMALHKSDELMALIEKHWGKIEQASPGEKRARVHGIKVSLNLAPGSAAAGKPLFEQHCASCHTLFGAGNKIGPELTGADRKNLDFLLTNVVDPSAMIRKEYFSYTVQTTDGRVFNGLIAESTPTTVTILDAKNQRTVIPQDEVDVMERSPLSLMPEKLFDQLTAQQVRDLVSYLQSEAPQAQ